MQTGILSFNHPNLTAQCVAQALKFVAPQNLTLLHNGSKTENVQLLKAQFPEIVHFETEKNSGFSGGANALLTQIYSRNQWAFFLTNDCLLQTQPEQPQKRGFYAPQIFRRKLGVVDSVGGLFYPTSGKLRHIREEHRAQSKIAKYNSESPEKWKRISRALVGYYYVPGTAFYLDRDTFHNVGGFDETLHTYWEDVDFSVRAHLQGQTLGFCPHTKIIHKVGKTCHKDPFYTNYLFQKNRALIRKRYSLWSSLL